MQRLLPQQIISIFCQRKHHLLPLDKVIAPYDVSLKKILQKRKIELSGGEKVIEELKKVADIKKDKFIILAGKLCCSHRK